MTPPASSSTSPAHAASGTVSAAIAGAPTAEDQAELRKVALSIVAYVPGVPEDRRYQTCVSAVVVNWRSAIEIASADI
jgi:hypothetical protein